jgi:hypothetical protein
MRATRQVQARRRMYSHWGDDFAQEGVFERGVEAQGLAEERVVASEIFGVEVVAGVGRGGRGRG